jgi:transaldolase
VTANPTIFAKAIEGSDAYDEQFAALTAAGRSTPDAYWALVLDDISQALRTWMGRSRCSNSASA